MLKVIIFKFSFKYYKYKFKNFKKYIILIYF